MYQNGNQLLLRTCVLLCCYRRGPPTGTKEAHIKELCGRAPTWCCSAPVSFRQLLRCFEEDRFRSCHHVHVQRLEGTSRHLPSCSALCSSDSKEVLRAAADCLARLRNCQFSVTSLCRACRCGSEQSLRCLYVPQNFPICSLRFACPETSLRRSADSLVCAPSLLDLWRRLKKVLASSLKRSTQSAHCASGGGSSRVASNLCLACSGEFSTACRNSHRLSPLSLETVYNRLQVSFVSMMCLRLSSLRL